jgi:uncharacterized membrane protein YhaH (DUF805 family)
MIWLFDNYFTGLFKNNTFDGRARRLEYWGFALLNYMIEFIGWLLNPSKQTLYFPRFDTLWLNILSVGVFLIVAVLAIILSTSTS